MNDPLLELNNCRRPAGNPIQLDRSAHHNKCLAGGAKNRDDPSLNAPTSPTLAQEPVRPSPKHSKASVEPAQAAASMVASMVGLPQEAQSLKNGYAVSPALAGHGEPVSPTAGRSTRCCPARGRHRLSDTWMVAGKSHPQACAYDWMNYKSSSPKVNAPVAEYFGAAPLRQGLCPDHRQSSATVPRDDRPTSPSNDLPTDRADHPVPDCPHRHPCSLLGLYQCVDRDQGLSVNRAGTYGNAQGLPAPRAHRDSSGTPSRPTFTAKPHYPLSRLSPRRFLGSGGVPWGRSARCFSYTSLLVGGQLHTGQVQISCRCNNFVSFSVQRLGYRTIPSGRRARGAGHPDDAAVSVPDGVSSWPVRLAPATRDPGDREWLSRCGRRTWQGVRGGGAMLSGQQGFPEFWLWLRSVSALPGYGLAAVVITLAYFGCRTWILPIYVAGLERLAGLAAVRFPALGGRAPLRNLPSVVLAACLPGGGGPASIFTFSSSLSTTSPVTIVGRTIQMLQTSSTATRRGEQPVPFAATVALYPCDMLVSCRVRRTGALDNHCRGSS